MVVESVGAQAGAGISTSTKQGPRGLHLMSELPDHAPSPSFHSHPHFPCTPRVQKALGLLLLQRDSEIGQGSGTHRGHHPPSPTVPALRFAGEGLLGRVMSGWAAGSCYYWGTEVPQTPIISVLPQNTWELLHDNPGSYKLLLPNAQLRARHIGVAH